MRQLFVLKKEFGTEHNISVINRKGDILYNIKREIESENFGKYTICNTLSNDLVQVIHDKNQGCTTVDVNIAGNCIFTLKQGDDGLDESYQVVDSPVELYGDWRGLNFDIVSGYRKVAKVRNRWISYGDSLELTVFEEPSELVSLGILVALESVNQNQLIESIEY